MTTLVIGSVLVYSFFLPQQAPKQITLAVLPFTENSQFTPRSIGFSMVLRDSIALSRDVAVIDSISTYAVMWNPEKASEMANILAITHFVDGELHRSADTLSSVDFRVVNVSQPNWKEVHVSALENLSTLDLPIQSARDDITQQVRTALYDNSFMRTESSNHSAETFGAFVLELGSWMLKYRDDESISELHERFRLKSHSLFTKIGIASDPSRFAWDSMAKFLSDHDLAAYADTLWHLAGEYPNGLAVDVLAQMAYDLGKFEVAEKLWLRVARVQPQSANVALNIANVRRVLGNQEGVDQALRIAMLRDELGLVNAYEISELDSDDNDSSLSMNEWQDLFTLDEDGSAAVGGDMLMESLIRQDGLETHRAATLQPTRLWLKPPKFLANDDIRWRKARDYLKLNFDSANTVVPSGVLSQAQQASDVDQLMAPMRPD